jgi:hypothetical protein
MVVAVMAVTVLRQRLLVHLLLILAVAAVHLLAPEAQALRV